jgi:PadR family transcriptional regulator PadR
MGKRFRPVRLTVPTLKVLGSVLASAPDELAGVEIAGVTKLPSGTLYPILLRLEEAGWLESRWESDDPRALGRPRRRMYRLTALGAKQTRIAFREVKSAIGEALWT